MDDALVRLFVKKVDTHVLQWPTYRYRCGMPLYAPPCFWLVACRLQPPPRRKGRLRLPLGPLSVGCRLGLVRSVSQPNLNPPLPYMSLHTVCIHRIHDTHGQVRDDYLHNPFEMLDL